MSWTPKTASSIPKVIAGPILRKVTPYEVSVFIVTKDNASVQLKIYEPVTSNVVLSSAVVSPVKLGDNVYLITITARSATAVLQSGKTYGYNLFWGSNHLGSNNVLVNGTGSTLSVAYNVSSNNYNVGGVSMKLPTFILPPTNIKDLWILHGSCRKPHGEGYDAMEGMNKIIEQAVTSSTPDVRPHMMFLTGDQIYADDVADALLHMIMKTADSLMNWSESFPLPTSLTDLEEDVNDKYNRVPYPSGNATGNIKAENAFLPGLRNTYINKTAKLTPDPEECTSHLMQFREYAMMYLFAWSDVLWGTTLPSFSEAKYLLLTNNTQVQLQPTFTETVHRFTKLDRLIIQDETTDVNGSPTYDLHCKRLEKFRKTIPDVRKAMANIPVYMVLDDHEVTDDLFFNREWYDAVWASSTAGRAIVRNGLIAYSLFQAWGNTPEQFQSTGTAQETVGFYLLGDVASIVNNPASTNTSWLDALKKVYPGVGTEAPTLATGITTYTTTGTTNVSYSGVPQTVIQYNYIYTYTGLPFEVISLDTRRNRAFRHGNDGKPGLMSDWAIQTQVKNIGNDKKDLTILLSPTPILGHHHAESKIDFGVNVKDTFYSINPLFFGDMERWNADIFFLYEMLFKIMTRANNVSGQHRAVVLGGDVHYAFTKGLEIKSANPFMENSLPANSRLALASLCASAFKNQKDSFKGTKALHEIGPDSEDDYEAWCYNNYAHTTMSVTWKDANGDPYVWYNDATPYIHKKEPFMNTLVSPSPDFYSKVSMKQSGNFYAYTPLFSFLSNNLSSYNSALAEHKRYCFDKAKKGGKYTSGKNTFGEVVFNWTTGNKYVQHNLWWREDEWNEASQTLIPISNKAVHQVSLEYTY